MLWEIYFSPGVTTQILPNTHFWLWLVCISVSLKVAFKGSSAILEEPGKGHVDSPLLEQQALPERSEKAAKGLSTRPQRQQCRDCIPEAFSTAGAPTSGVLHVSAPFAVTESDGERGEGTSKRHFRAEGLNYLLVEPGSKETKGG